MICLKVYDAQNHLLAISRGDDLVNLVLAREYQIGDKISLEVPKQAQFVWLQVDDALGSSLCYVTGTVDYIVPFAEKRINISPKAFYGNKHLLKAKIAKDYEYTAYRNLALNVNDQHTMKNCFPHAMANVETRGESVFAAQNAINGNTCNTGHGEWPYESWGINRDPNACLRIDFGRLVEIDTVILTTRADFPHDNWWKQAELRFSDETSMEITMDKSSLPHIFPIENKQTKWIELTNLKQSTDPSPFPALTQIEAWGRDIVN